MSYSTMPLPGGGFAIICSRGRVARCQEPGCGTAHTRLCDYPTKKQNSNGTIKTCDRRLCDAHATKVGLNLDYCPVHAAGRVIL